MRGKKTQNSQLIIIEEQSHKTDTKATCNQHFLLFTVLLHFSIIFYIKLYKYAPVV